MDPNDMVSDPESNTLRSEEVSTCRDSDSGEVDSGGVASLVASLLEEKRTDVF